MTHPKVRDRAAGVGRLGTAAAWISAVCCLPYLVLKVVWTVGVPWGITDRSLFDESGWAAANAVMAVIELTGLALVLALTRPWSRRVPVWLVLVPVWVGTGLLFEISVGAVLVGLFSSSSQTADASTGIEPWVFVLVYTSFAGQGVALAIAFACHVRARWGQLLGARTADVLPQRTARARSRAERHLAQNAEVIAALAAAVAFPFVYWTAGGSFGLSSAQPHPEAGLQASRVIGALVAAVGLLGLAGRWGSQRRFWLPVTLTWLGSGALVAFDGLNLALNRLFALFGVDTAQSDWSPIDTALVVKVVIGLVAAAIGALAVMAAARGSGTSPADGQPHSRSAPRWMPHRRSVRNVTVPRSAAASSRHSTDAVRLHRTDVDVHSGELAATAT